MLLFLYSTLDIKYSYLSKYRMPTMRQFCKVMQ